MRAGRDRADLPARELDRAVAGQLNDCRSELPRRRSPRCPRSRRGAPGWRWSRSRSIEPVLSSDAAVTLSGAERRAVADVERAAVGQRPRHGQARSAVAALSRRDRRFRHWRARRSSTPRRRSRDRRSPATSASPVRALFEPSAVLSSMKASFPLRNSFASAASVVICPLANSIALSPPSPTLPLKTSRGAESRAARGHVEERLVGAGAGQIGSSPYCRATPPSPCPTPRACVLPMVESSRCWSAPPPRSGSIRRRR